MQDGAGEIGAGEISAAQVAALQLRVAQIAAAAVLACPRQERLAVGRGDDWPRRLIRGHRGAGRGQQRERRPRREKQAQGHPVRVIDRRCMHGLRT